MISIGVLPRRAVLCAVVTTEESGATPTPFFIPEAREEPTPENVFNQYHGKCLGMICTHSCGKGFLYFIKDFLCTAIFGEISLLTSVDCHQAGPEEEARFGNTALPTCLLVQYPNQILVARFCNVEIHPEVGQFGSTQG